MDEKEKRMKEFTNKINNHRKHIKRKYENLTTNKEEIYYIIDDICDEEIWYIALDIIDKTPEQIKERVRVTKKFIKNSIKEKLENKKITLTECISKIKSFKYYTKRKLKYLDTETKKHFYDVIDEFCEEDINLAKKEKDEHGVWKRLQGAKHGIKEWVEQNLRYKKYLEDLKD